MEFAGLPAEFVDFLMEIRMNNNVEYFNANRKRYEALIKNPLYALADALGPIVLAVDPKLDVRASRSVSRMRRDTRFTKDKSPYRDHMWIGWRRLGEGRMNSIGLYWEVSPEATSWGCGVYSDVRGLMEQIRADMVEHPKPYLDMLKGLRLGDRFTLHGNEYKRLKIPEALHPELHTLYIKKGFYVRNVPRPDDYDSLFNGSIVDRLAEDYAMLAPMYHLMRKQEAIVCQTDYHP